jgi:hypothetical protein
VAGGFSWICWQSITSSVMRKGDKAMTGIYHVDLYFDTMIPTF